jgi:hypothetical protein
MSQPRQKNWRLVGAGLLLWVLNLVFFLWAGAMASKSTDPAEMMRISGQVSGVASGLALFLVILGLVGKKPPA